MDFIINNYMWFGIAGVVLLLALIGFLAEKTNFIATNKVSKEEKKSKKKNKPVPQKPVATEKVIPDVQPKPLNGNVDPLNMPIDQAVNSIGKQSMINKKTTDDEVLNFDSILNGAEPTLKKAPLPTAKNDKKAMNQSVVTSTGENLAQPFGNVPVKPVVENNIPVNNQTVAVQDEEDIWKF